MVILLEKGLLRHKGLSSGFLHGPALVKIIVVLRLLRFSVIHLPNDRVLAIAGLAPRPLDLPLRRLVKERLLLEKSEQVVLVTHKFS